MTKDKNPKPNLNIYPNNIPLKNKDKFPNLPSFVYVTNGIAKPTVDTSSTNANIRALVLDDQDLINVENPSMVLLVKLKYVNTMSNMYVIYGNEDINGIEKVEDSIGENSLADLNDLNDLKETINELASNEIQHPINKENMDQEDDINKVSPEIAVSSDLSRPPGFEHMKRTSSNLARGRSGGLISMWDPNSFIKDDIWCDDSFIIVKGHWRNTVGDCYMINIYGPQDSLAKAILRNRIDDFMHQHSGKYIIFGDINVVRNENERSGSLFSRQDADNFNSFTDNSSLIDLPLGGYLFTWMNKARIKLSKVDQFLISEEVAKALPDVRVTTIYLIKTELPKLEEHNFERKLLSHENFRILKARIKQWHSETKTSDRVTKHDNLQLIKSIEKKIEAGSANDDDRDSRIKLLQEVDRLDIDNAQIEYIFRSVILVLCMIFG
ncbi:RNA-directed DNA polymerase, eukaryota, reverse transcriptase zinc-binding domain protein [Tanacetum coccineum]